MNILPLRVLPWSTALMGVVRGVADFYWFDTLVAGRNATSETKVGALNRCRELDRRAEAKTWRSASGLFLCLVPQAPGG